MIRTIIGFNIICIFLIVASEGSIHIDNENKIYNIYSFLGGFSLLAIISCYTYYYIYKKYDLLLIAIVYMNYLVVDGYLKFLDILNILESNQNRQVVFTSFLIRTILLFQIIKPNKTIKKIFNKYKILSSIGVCLITIVTTNIELYIFRIYGLNNFRIIIEIIKIIITIANLYVVFYMIKKGKNDKNILYVIIAFSINCFALSRIFILNRFFGNTVNLLIVQDGFTLIGYMIISIGVFIELTFRIKQTGYLKEELEIFYEIAENSEVDGIMITDLEGNVLYQNRKYIDFLILELGEFQRRFLSGEEMSAANRKVIKNFHILEKKAKDELSRTGIFRGTVFTYSDKVLEVYVQIIKTKNGKSVLMNQFTERTEEFTNSLKLKRNEEKLSTINKNIKDFIIMLDNKGIITYTNPYTINSLGYNFSDMIGKPFDNFIEIYDKKNESILCKEEVIRKQHLITKNGEKIAIESIETKIEQSDDGDKGKIIVGRDLRKRREFEVLQKKYTEISEYNKIREEFFANISHEVRTPLNIIYSSTQLLKHNRRRDIDKFIECYDRYEESITQNCYRMLRLVNNILALSKIESEAVELLFSNNEVISLIEEATLSVIPYVESKDINIIFDTNVEELYVKCDAEKIEKVILNLISNAVKFTKNGGNILVECFEEEEWFKVRVKDDGVGVPYTMKNIIFERFSQLDKSFNRANEGSGIGLALAKSIISVHNGEIYLEETNIGASFIFKIPNIKEESVESISENEHVCSKISERVLIELSDIY